MAAKSAEQQKIERGVEFDNVVRKSYDNLSGEDVQKMREKFLGKSEEYSKLSAREKTDQALNDMEKHMLSALPPINQVKKEIAERAVYVETDGVNIKGPKHPHVNMRAQKVALVMTTENGKVIHFDNQEVQEELRKAQNKAEEHGNNIDRVAAGLKTQEQALHDARNDDFE